MDLDNTAKTGKLELNISQNPLHLGHARVSEALWEDRGHTSVPALPAGLEMAGLTGLSLAGQADILRPSTWALGSKGCTFNRVPMAALAPEKVGSLLEGPCCLLGGPGFLGALLKA